MTSPRPTKRRRCSGYISPPLTDDDNLDNLNVLNHGLNVLKTEAEALASISQLYATSETARDGLTSAVKAVVNAHTHGGKLIVCGVGKSAYIAMKLVATSKSLGIPASFMHATEAAHGDLGDVRAKDVLLFVSFSGKTPELLNVLPHVPKSVRVMAMTSHLTRGDCQLLADRTDGILLPAPIHEKEETTFGVCAPTTSTTVALAVSDMLALTVANELHQGKTKQVFKRNHPGGAIGMTHREVEALKESEVDVSVVELPSPSIAAMEK